MKKLILCLLVLSLLCAALISCGGNDIAELEKHLTELCNDEDERFWAEREFGLDEIKDELEDEGFDLDGELLAYIELGCRSEAGDDALRAYIIVCKKQSDAKQMEKDAEDVWEDEFDKFLCKRRGNIVFMGDRAAVNKASDY